jgi:hypothetical protein
VTLLDVSEIMIAPPLSRRGPILRRRERLENYLQHLFPQYEFRLIDLAPVSDEQEFVVIPVSGFVGDDGQCHECRPVPVSTLSEIRQALHNIERTSALSVH